MKKAFEQLYLKPEEFQDNDIVSVYQKLGEMTLNEAQITLSGFQTCSFVSYLSDERYPVIRVKDITEWTDEQLESLANRYGTYWYQGYVLMTVVRIRKEMQ